MGDRGNVIGGNASGDGSDGVKAATVVIVAVMTVSAVSSGEIMFMVMVKVMVVGHGSWVMCHVSWVALVATVRDHSGSLMDALVIDITQIAITYLTSLPCARCPSMCPTLCQAL